VSLLPQVTTHFLGNDYSPESTSFLNSCCRCLLDWSHYRKQQAETALALASLRLNEMQTGWSFRHLWNPIVTTVGNLFTRPDSNAQIAEESARSCLAGLSRLVVTAEPKVAPKPDTDGAIGSVPDLEPQPPLLSMVNLD
jgi:hypothetical protein